MKRVDTWKKIIKMKKYRVIKGFKVVNKILRLLIYSLGAIEHLAFPDEYTEVVMVPQCLGQYRRGVKSSSWTREYILLL